MKASGSAANPATASAPTFAETVSVQDVPVLPTSMSKTYMARSTTLGFLGRSRGAVPCLRSPSVNSLSGHLDDSAKATSSTARPDGEDPDAVELRLRFFNFNMGNNSNFTSVKELLGPSGQGTFMEHLQDPLQDGGQADIVFVSLVETRLNLTEWGQEYKGASSRAGGALDGVLLQNARREGLQTASRVRGWVEGLAKAYNGNLKSVLVYNSSRLEEDTCSQVFGRLIEARVVGVPVPNPKKAFMGRSLRKKFDNIGVRLCFISAHFPVMKLAAALEDKAIDQLHGAKVALARSLRKVLRKATDQRVVDGNTVLFLQGDLNSRTVLRHESVENEYAVELERSKNRRLGLDVGKDDNAHYRGSLALVVTTLRGGCAAQWNKEHPDEQIRIGDIVVEVNGVREDVDEMLVQFRDSETLNLKLHRKVTDVLLEVLRDDDMQEAIQHELGLPVGRWHEIAHYEIVHDLPVTYKFMDHVSCGSASGSSPSGSSPSHGRGGARGSQASFIPEPLPFPLTVGDIVACASVRAGAESEEEPAASPTKSKLLRPNFGTMSTGLTDEGPQGSELYRQHLKNLGEQKLAEFGLVYKKNDFRAFRFPACADRVLFWAPDSVSDRITFDLPQEGYEVNHCQLGSDHRPVTLEVVMRVAPVGKPVRPSQRTSRRMSTPIPVAQKPVNLDDPGRLSGEETPIVTIA